MAPKQISGWSLTETKRGDELRWTLTKEGHRLIKLRLQADCDDEIAVRHAMNAIDVAEADDRNKTGD